MTIGIRYATRSDTGMLRDINEDAAYAGPRVLALADGMGGHAGGEVASTAAIEILKHLDGAIGDDELLPTLEHAVQQANRNIHDLAEADPALKGAGTTLTAILWSDSKLALVQVGDSRAYLIRDGVLFQITHDQTLVQMLLDGGSITPDKAATHPMRSLLLQALDGRADLKPDLQLRTAHVGDRYLICSDGLWSTVPAETIHATLNPDRDPETVVRQLIDLANQAGGPDNITCIVADVVTMDDRTA